MPRVNVRYHALLREKTARDSESFELNSSATAGDLVANFAKKYPAFERLAAALHVAVNDEIVSRSHTLSENDRIDLMPPFGGG